MWSLIYILSTHIYPSYASYKALSSPPTSSDSISGRQVERWLTYWCVVGIWTGLEGSVEWGVRWIPFYGFFKCLFFLWLALPQTEGSTIIYTNIVAPLFAEHEDDIDAFLGGMRSRVGQGFVVGLNWLWTKFREQINLQASSPNIYGPHSGGPNAYPYDQGMMHQPPAIGNQPPTMQDPASGAVAGFYSLASRYAMQYLPVAATALANAVRPLAATTTTTTNPNEPSSSMQMPIPIPTPASSRTHRSVSHGQGYDVPTSFAGEQHDDRHDAARGYSSSVPMTAQRVDRRRTEGGKKSSDDSSESNEDGSGGRVRSSWGGTSGYEEIRQEDVEDEPVTPSSGRGSSWFGWGSTTPGVKPKSE